MDVDQLKARVAAARQFQHTFSTGFPDAISDVTFDLQMPTRHEMKLWTAMAEAESKGDLATSVVLCSYRMLLAAVRGWSGVTEAHFVEDATDPQPVAYHRNLIEPLLESQPDWARAITTELYHRITPRMARAEDVEKNLPSASLGTVLEPMHES